MGIGPSLQTETTALPRRLELPGIKDNTVAMAGSEIAIYPVSTHGMTSSSVGADVSGEAEVDLSGRNGIRTIEGQASRQYDLQVSMEHLASLTGGRAFLNTNDLAAGDGTQRGGRRPLPTAWTTRPRTRPGMGRTGTWRLPCGGHSYHLAYRQGYFATADAHPEAAGASGLSATLRQAALERSGILLRANVFRPRTPGGETTVDLLVDPSSVTFTTGADGLRHAKLLLLSAAAKDGAAGPEKQAVLNLGLEPADYQSVLASGIPVRQTIAGVPAAATLRVGVRDLETGQTGTLRLE